MDRRRRALLWASLACVAVACGRAPARPNVVVVVLDTLRADRLGVYGAARPTPFLDGLASQPGSVVFEHAYAASSWTVPSIASLFLAQDPAEHRVAVVNAILPDDAVTLAECLHDAGYRTGGVSANLEIGGDAGFGQGFESFRTVFRPPKEDAAAVTRAALEWLDDLDARGAPVFLYVQYMEPHSPYRVHEGLTPATPPPVPPGDAALAQRVNEGAFALRDGAPLPDVWRLSDAERARLDALYDGEVAYLDAALKTLFAELDRRGLLAHALVVVTADHGEELGEHGLFSHGNTLYEATIHVPLLVRVPDAAPARRVREPVAVDGLAPAILRAAGVDVPPSFHVPALALDGAQPTPWVLAEVLKESPTYLRLHRRALVGPAGKLLVGNDGAETFFDLAADPGEQRPLRDPPFAPALRAALAERGGGGAVPAPRAGAPLDATMRERLRALGYGD